MKKRVDQLQPGDIIPANPNPLVLQGIRTRRAILHIAPTASQPLEQPRMAITFGTINHGARAYTEEWTSASEVDVETPHCQELHDRLKWALNFAETYARPHMGPATPEWNKIRELLKVEPGTLTPAQQNAGLLVECVRQAEKIICNLYPQGYPQHIHDWIDPARSLLRQVTPKPPEPPTLDEALASLAELAANGGAGAHLENALRLLDRARQSGVLK